MAIPFTTPDLAGARARPAERAGLEFILPNPSGGRGVYILPWAGVRELCRPTLHDTRLNERIAALRGVTPEAIRQAAREIAAEGLAGRPARSAARLAAQAERQARLLTSFRLLLALVRQTERAGENPVPPEQDRPAEIERRAKRSIARLAPRLTLPPDAIAVLLEQLAELFAGIGIGPQAEEARLPRAMAALAALRDQMDSWRAGHPDDSGLAAQAIGASASLTLTCAAVTLADSRAMTDDVPGLLARWAATPDSIAGRAARTDWLLDGWERIVLLWRSAAEGASRRAALCEMLLLTPAIPREAREWTRLDIDAEGPMCSRGTVLLKQDWRTGMPPADLIAGNERLRAEAA